MRELSTRLRSGIRVCCRCDHLRVTGGVALIVGTWLTAINQADMILSHGFSVVILLKVLVNYLTPFIVSNAGLLARKA